MTRFRKQRLNKVVIYLLVFSMPIVLMLCRLYGQKSTWSNVLFPVYALLFICIAIYNYHKQQIILTNDERTTAISARTDFSNRFDWLNPLIYLSFFTTIDLMSGFSLIINLIGGNMSGILLIPVVLIPAIMFVPSFYHFRNQYIIEGNTLHVKEYSFFKLQTDIRIPLSSIHEIYVNNTLGFAASPNIYLNVDGIERKLHATSYALELAVVILQNK